MVNVASGGCVEVPVAVNLRPESAGPGQVATRVHSEPMLSPLPSHPPQGTVGYPPMGRVARQGRSSQTRGSHVMKSVIALLLEVRVGLTLVQPSVSEITARRRHSF